MTVMYCDVSAIGNGYQAYSDTPATWGIPQDGNGLGKTSEIAAVAIATIDVAGCTASGSGTISVLGVTVSSTLNATGAALATAIANAINASSTSVSSTYCAASLPLNKLVYARVNPALTTQVQIMMRIAGTDWVSYSPTQANISPAATISNFAGGVDGPFAYFFNIDTIFGKLVGSWGCFSSNRVGGTTEPDLTIPIYIRTKRSGVDLSVTMYNANNNDFSIVPKTSGTNHRLGVFDDGTTWIGDSGMFTATYTSYAYSGAVVYVGYSNQGSNRLYLTSLGTDRHGTINFLVTYSGSGARGYLGNTWSGCQMHIDKVNLTIDPASQANTPLYLSVNAQYGLYTFNKCKIRAKSGYLMAMGSSGSCKVVFNCCDFEYFNLTSSVSGLIGGSAGTNNSIDFIGCRFYDELGVFSVSSPFSSIGASDNPYRISFDGCSGISDVFSNIPPNSRSERILTWDDFGVDRAFHVETGAWLSQWIPNNNQPTLDQLTAGGTPWSIKTLIHTDIYQSISYRVVRILGRYLDTDSISTATIEILSQIPLSKHELILMFEYTNSDGTVKVENTDKGLLGSILSLTDTLDTSTAAWELNGVSGYHKYKISLTTSEPIKQNTDFNAYLLWRGSPSSDFVFYTNPGVSLS